MCLTGEAQYDDSGELRWWVGENVGEIEIQGNQHSILAPAYIDYTFIRLTAERLLDHGMRFVSGSAE